MISDITFSANGIAEPLAGAAEATFEMDEESFRAFYKSTARPLWGYLSRVLGDSAAADDLLQETYYRFLRARLPEMSDAQRKNYLFRIATNLMRDEWRRRKAQPPVLPENSPAARQAHTAADECAPDKMRRMSQLADVLGRMKPRERELLWLAYVEGASHKEIADLQGLRATSVRVQLFRVRRRLAGLLRRRGFDAGGA